MGVGGKGTDQGTRGPAASTSPAVRVLPALRSLRRFCSLCPGGAWLCLERVCSVTRALSPGIGGDRRAGTGVEGTVRERLGQDAEEEVQAPKDPGCCSSVELPGGLWEKGRFLLEEAGPAPR